MEMRQKVCRLYGQEASRYLCLHESERLGHALTVCGQPHGWKMDQWAAHNMVRGWHPFLEPNILKVTTTVRVCARRID